MSTHYALFLFYFGDIKVKCVGMYNSCQWHIRALKYNLSQSFFSSNFVSLCHCLPGNTFKFISCTVEKCCHKKCL